jgi:hypothetical protein
MTEKTVVTAAGADDFDISKYRLPQNFCEAVALKRIITGVPVHKPNKQVFVRVHPSQDYSMQAAVLDLKDDNETYLVAPTLWAAIQSEIVYKTIYTAIDRQGTIFLWPVKLPPPDGRLDHWNLSAMEAVSHAKKSWIRVVPQRTAGCYEVMQAQQGIPEPEWPDLSFDEIMKIAFKDNRITDINHPVLRKLRGEL